VDEVGDDHFIHHGSAKTARGASNEPLLFDRHVGHSLPIAHYC